MLTYLGKIHHVGKKQAKGKDPNKPFYIRNFVVEGEKLEKVVFQLKQEGTDIIEERHVGQQVEVTFKYDTREYNGDWYMNLQASDVAFINEKTGELKGKDIPEKLLVDDDVDDQLPF